MDLSWIEDFLAIAEGGGFSRAAERRHVTQPALSRRIKAFEEWMGTPLFERSTHTVVLTPAGEAFRPVAEDVLRRVYGGRDEAREVARLKAETVCFGATHALSQTFFPDWIRSNESTRANAAVQLVTANFAGCEKLLLEAQIHFLLTHHHPSMATRLDEEQFRHLELGRETLIPVSAPATEETGRRGRRRPQTGARHLLPGSTDAPLPFLAHHPGSGIGRIVTAFLAGKTPTARLAPSFSAPTMLLIDVAREGRGITWAPLSLVERDLTCGRLVRAGDTDWDIDISICLFRSRARLTRAAEAFWNAVQKGKRKEPLRGVAVR